MRQQPSRPKPARSDDQHMRRIIDIGGIILVTLGAIMMVSLLTSNSGVLGAGIESVLRGFAGIGAFVIPPIVMLMGVLLLLGHTEFEFGHTYWGLGLALLAVTGWATLPLPFDQLYDPEFYRTHGGLMGSSMLWVLLSLVGRVGTGVVLTALCLVALLLTFDIPAIALITKGVSSWRSGMTTARKGAQTVKRNAQRIPTVREMAQNIKVQKSTPKPLAAIYTPPVGDLPAEATVAAGPMPNDDLPIPTGTRKSRSPRGAKAQPESADGTATAVQQEIDFNDVEGFILPPLDLLKPSPPAPKRQDEEVQKKIKVLESTLEQFGIEATVAEVASGPTVTRYEILLGPGVRVSKIVSLADNIAMALAAIDVRVEAPIPGKSAIGVEVPNDSPRMVTLRELMEDEGFRRSSSLLTFALGRDVANVAHCADLTKMPHLLIGGSTNSGKSICLNTLICSWLYRATPKQVKLILIDPKRVELALFEGIPHLACPVVKDVKQAAGVLKAAIKEMDRRYTMFSNMRTRNIEGYNSRCEPEEKLPYVVIVIDELADMMMQVGAEVEASICRLAQLARATGIHLVIATQRPSVNVITGLIKANISSRLAFAVSSGIDSRTILDMSGAERLIGKGDMLFMPIDANKPVRLQGCFVSETEVNDLCKYLKSQGLPEYTIMPVESSDNEPGEFDEPESDELFEAAVRLVVMNGQASTSMLQRRFRVGYTRAARLVDMMEARGIVGALEGAKPREILMSRDEVEHMFSDDDTDETG